MFIESDDPYNVKTRASAGNYSGYNITYGTLNGDAYVFFADRPIPDLYESTLRQAKRAQLRKMFAQMSDAELHHIYRNSWSVEGLEALLSKNKAC